MLLLGHRGARATRSIPENTIASFDLALAHGCDGFEFDVRLTADGHAVICHDEHAHGLEIARCAQSDLHPLPLLDDVLSRYQRSAWLDIELKVPGLEPSLISSLKLHPPSRGYVVSSFLPDVLRSLHTLASEFPLGLIAETPGQLALWQSLPITFVMPHFTLINIDLCESLHAAGKKICVWTVNSRQRMHHCLELNVDAIISDDTELLAALRP
jgi:glycerophosphoryl diester phosphodiesterase